MKPRPSKPRGRSGSGVRGTTLADSIVPRLQPVAAARVERWLGELKAAMADAAGGGDGFPALLSGRPKLGAFIASVLECSPFLRSLILADPSRLLAILSDEPTG